MDTKQQQDDFPRIQAAVQLEYTALRNEILKRIELRQQVIQIALAFAGVLFSFGVARPGVAFVFPPLAALMATAWAQNDFRIRDLGTYLRDRIEPNLAGLGWETHLQKGRKASPDTTWRRTVYSHGGIFLGTQIIAIGIGLANFSNSLVEWILLFASFASMRVAYTTIEKASRR